jgi:hypothetical protein
MGNLGKHVYKKKEQNGRCKSFFLVITFKINGSHYLKIESRRLINHGLRIVYLTDSL